MVCMILNMFGAISTCTTLNIFQLYQDLAIKVFKFDHWAAIDGFDSANKSLKYPNIRI